EREAEIDEMMSTWTRQHTKHEAMRLIGAAGIPAGAVNDTNELQNDPTFESRGIMQWIDHPGNGKFKMPAWPVRHNGAPPKVEPSPLLGQNNAEVLGSWLKMGARDIEQLRRDKVIGG